MPLELKEVRIRVAILRDLFLEEGNCPAITLGSLPLHSCGPSKQHVRVLWLFLTCYFSLHIWGTGEHSKLLMKKGLEKSKDCEYRH